MCLAVPVKVLEILDAETVSVSSRGLKFQASSILIDDIKQGDYVLVHAGFIIEKLSKEYAAELLEFYGDDQ